LPDGFPHGQKQFAFRLGVLQGFAIEQKLAQRGIQVLQQRTAQKAFDFDGNPAHAFLSEEQLFRRQVNLDITVVPIQRQRISRDCPTVLSERDFDLFVIEVFRCHRRDCKPEPGGDKEGARFAG
jgi:hypothetical protein